MRGGRSPANLEGGNPMLKPRFALIAAPALALAASPAAANISGLTSAVDFSAVRTALVAVAALLIAVLVLRKGIRFVMGSIK